MIVKRVFIILIVLLLIFTPARNCYAAAETAALTVVGGSVAAGGIGAALVAFAPVALVVAGVALAAQGIYVFLNDDSIEEGKTNLDFIGERLQEFCVESGRSYGDFCRTLAEGSSVSADGKIVLTNAASGLISQWINSLKAEDEIVTEPSYAERSISINGVDCPVIGKNEYVLAFRAVVNGNSFIMRVENSRNPEIAVFSYYQDGFFRLCCISVSSDASYVLYDQNDSDRGGSSGLPFLSKSGISYTYSSQWTDYVVDNYLPVISNFPKCLDDMDGFNVKEGLGENSFVCGDLSNVDGSVFNPADGNVNIIDTGLNLDSIASSYGKTGTITVENYLDALTRALNGVADNTIAINDTLTGVLDNVSVGVYNPQDVASVTEEDKDLAYAVDLTQAIDLEKNPEGEMAEEALKGMQFDLTHIFPFCIPFDLYALVEKFDVTPVTPNVHLVIPLGGISEDLVLDLDFAPFETVAQVLRTMELIAFVVGLAMVTRHIIRG